MTRTVSPAAERVVHRAVGRPSADAVLVTRVGLDIDPGICFDSWHDAGRKIGRIATTSAWCLGDWLNFGADNFPGRYRVIIDAVDLDYQTLRNYSWVARRVSRERRRPELTFQHHAEVAALDPHEQCRVLAACAAGGWSRNELRRRVRAGQVSSLSTRPAVVASALEPEEPTGQPREVDVPSRLERITVDLDPDCFATWNRAATRAGRPLQDWVRHVVDDALASGITRQ